MKIIAYPCLPDMTVIGDGFSLCLSGCESIFDALVNWSDDDIHDFIVSVDGGPFKLF